MTANPSCSIAPNTIKKVLIAEDESVQRHLLRGFLCEAGYEVIEAVDGQEALEKLALDPGIRFVITDLKMPRLDGFSLITEIRKKKSHYIYILVETHREDEDALVKAFSFGADDFLKKPVCPIELCFRVAGGFRVLKLEQFEESIFLLTKLAALQSKETGSHLDRMYHFTKALVWDLVANAPELGLTHAMAEEIVKVSPLHDMGKVCLSLDLLNKAEKLNHEEVRGSENTNIPGSRLDWGQIWLCRLSQSYGEDFAIEARPKMASRRDA